MKIGFSGQYTYWTPMNNQIEEKTNSLFDNNLLNNLQNGINGKEGYTIRKSFEDGTYILNNDKNEPTTVRIGYSTDKDEIRFSREGLSGQETLILNTKNTNRQTWQNKAKKIISELKLFQKGQ